jgi:hypothetical protein
MTCDFDEQEHSKSETQLMVMPPPLAWDKNGKRFRVPAESKGWRVHNKPEAKGARAMPVFTPAGPLHLDIDATFDALAQAVNDRAGWYVLHVVGENYVLLPDTPSAYVQVVGRPGQESEKSEVSTTVDRLCVTLQQLAFYSVKRDEAICNALAQCSGALSEIQKSTAEILRAATSSLDIAAGAALPKLPPPPPAPQLPPPPPQKSVIDFLTSPAGNTTVAALANVVTSITGNKNS